MLTVRDYVQVPGLGVGVGVVKVYRQDSVTVTDKIQL